MENIRISDRANRLGQIAERTQKFTQDNPQEIKTIRVIGQKNVALKRLDLREGTDAERIKRLEESKGFQQYFPEDQVSTSVSALIRDYGGGSPERRNTKFYPDTPNQPLRSRHGLNWLRRQVTENAGLFYGIVASENNKTIDPSEIGQLQGWMMVYNWDRTDKDTMARFREFKKNGLLPSDIKHNKLYEISYAKVPDAPEGQMGSGVRQALLDLSRISAVSKKDKLKPDITVISSIEVGNEASVKLATSAGFERTGRYEEKDEDTGQTKTYELYTLNWDKLQQRVTQDAIGGIFSREDTSELQSTMFTGEKDPGPPPKQVLVGQADKRPPMEK